MERKNQKSTSDQSGYGPTMRAAQFRRHGKRAARRGVLLLVVLSLLSLFALIGVTFVLVTSQAKRTARADAKLQLQVTTVPSEQMDDAFRQLIRDSNNPLSSMQFHSLLGDMYGQDGVRGKIGSVGSGSTPPFIDVFVSSTDLTNLVDPSSADSSPTLMTTPTTTQLQTNGYYNGCVFTVTSGDAANQSARIVGWGFSSSTFTIRIAASHDFPISNANSLKDQTFVINGRPFNGTGLGFRSSGGAADLGLAGAGGVPVVYLPNTKFVRQTDGSIATPPNVGGTDEDYDAPDPHNMALAYVPITPNSGSIASGDILPSFHRPDMVNFLQNGSNAYASGWSDPNVQRQAIMRPLKTDHPSFTGGNTNPSGNPLGFDPINGPWDVDNDGDGIADSVWIDLGMPVATAANGRQYKPLFAFLVVDMDGRLNVNAHGNLMQTNANYYAPVSGSGTIGDYAFSTTPTTSQSLTLKRGGGYGPAEVSLSGLGVNPSTLLASRFGAMGSGPDNVLDGIKRFDFPLNPYPTASSTTTVGYGTPPDLWGRAALALDFAGQPMWSYLSGALANASNPPTAPNDMPNDPYALNLFRSRGNGSTATVGNPFSSADLERVLRANDFRVASTASQAPSPRLAQLLDPTLDATTLSKIATLMTTDSFDLPSPGFLPTKDMIAALNSAGITIPANLNILDLLRAKMQNGGGTFPANNLASMLPPEVIAGQRFDLNRPFGNGIDDDGDYIVDEPDEYSTNNEAPPASAANLPVSTNWQAQLGTTPFNLTNNIKLDGTAGNATATDAALARQQYAKYLYILMMLFSDTNFQTEPGANQAEINARRIAQWAINVVDFRDPDSIMTQFEYDVNPFNNLTVDWNPATDSSNSSDSTDRRVVWGVEYPDLLLTETLALHDRRVKDVVDGDGVKNDMKGSNGMTKDIDFDQYRVPQGSVFFELYCPRNGNASIAGPSGSRWDSFPKELYSPDTAGNPPQLDLGKMANDGSHWPVWRIAITQSGVDVQSTLGSKPFSANLDPVPSSGSATPNASLFDPSNPNGSIKIERVVWFTNDTSIPPLSSDPTVINGASSYQGTNATLLVSPGQYAVIGPRAITPIGMTSPAMGPAALAQQKIDLSNGKVVYTSANTSTPNNVFQSTTDAVSMICEANLPGWPTPVGVSVSEPLLSSYYSKVPTVAGPSGETDTYLKAYDKPFDNSAGMPISSLLPMAAAGMQAANFKTALLQRLANPQKGFNADTNPYITVDWQPINLNIFNGEQYDTDPASIDKDDSFPYASPSGPLLLSSRERGPTQSSSDLWTSLLPYLPISPANASGVGSGQAVVDFNIRNTLGALNQSMGAPLGATALAVTSGYPSAAKSYAYKNAPKYDATNGPTLPFSWLTWNNRPFANQGELMLVPSTSAEQTLRLYSSNTGGNPFSPTSFVFPFQHLMNFWMSNDGSAGSAPYYYRALEFLHVPSRFVGTETFMKPLATGLSSEQSLGSLFYAPFNKISHYREPGRVNINTIPTTPDGADNRIWNALHNNPNGTFAEPLWANLLNSRAGMPYLLPPPSMAPAMSAPFTVGNLLFAQDANRPSYFSRPFRTAGGSAFSLPGVPAVSSTGTDIEVSATLERPDPQNPTQPLLNLPATGTLYADPNRNAYFRYEPAMRLSSVLTTRSNVYAVWITMGYFEVTSVTADPAKYPDGFMLGQELGSDTGDTKRHRAFYMYDRSIPVGFQFGHDLNIDKGVLLKRYIQ